jgi:hypothetical protein
LAEEVNKHLATQEKLNATEASHTAIIDILEQEKNSHAAVLDTLEQEKSSHIATKNELSENRVSLHEKGITLIGLIQAKLKVLEVVYFNPPVL